MTSPNLYDSHMHTPLCKHAWGTPDDYAAAAEKRNLKGIIFTCHNPGPDGWSSRVRMSMNQLDEYVELVESASQKWRGRVDVRLGLECDYMPGMEPMLAELLTKAPFNHVLGSIHPQLPYYKDTYFQGDVVAFQKTYFQHLAMAAETGLFDTLSHPDLVKNMHPNQWQPSDLALEIGLSLDRIAAAGTAMELNSSGIHKAIKEMNPNPMMLAEMNKRGIPVVLGSDAHRPERVAAEFEDAISLLEDAGFSHASFFLNRQRQEVSLVDARSGLKNGAVKQRMGAIR